MTPPHMLIRPNSVIEGQNKPLNFVHEERFFLYGDIDQTVATEIIPSLVSVIEKKRKERNATIQFYIDTNGGYADYTDNLISLFERARAFEIVIETYVFGKAYSAGSLIACAGNAGHRFVGEGAEHLCHLGSSGTKRVINDVEIEREAGRVKHHFDRVRHLYRKYARIKNLDKVIHNDSLFIRGNDIIENGLADKLV